MAYVAPIHRASSVRHALLVRLSEDETSLVIAKANRLELWRSQDPSSPSSPLALVQSHTLNGNITMLQKLQPKDSLTEILFLGTARFQYMTLQCNAAGKLETIEVHTDIAESHMRDTASQDKCLVDPTGRYMIMHLWEGVLNVARLGQRKDTRLKLQWMDQIRISELFVTASTFLYSETGHPKIAMLYQEDTEAGAVRLVTYRLMSDDKDSIVGKFDPARDREINIKMQGDPGAALLIPVAMEESDMERKRHNFRNVRGSGAKPNMGGLVVVGETRMMYVDAQTKLELHKPLSEATIWTTWVRFDDRHYILSDQYGKIYLLTLVGEDAEVTGLDVTHIGKSSVASKMVYWDQLLFIGSHFGDSQLYWVDLKSQDRQYLNLVQTMPNIGPILDFAVMDMGNREGDSQLGNAYSSGQARLVTGSGIHKDGSLRSVRSGVGLEDVGILADMGGIRDVFALRSCGGTTGKVDVLVLSFLEETRIFRFDADGEVEEVQEFQGFVMNEPTMLVMDLPGGQRLQVTPKRILHWFLQGGGHNSTATPSATQGGTSTFTSCSASENWLLVAVDGKTLRTYGLRYTHPIESFAEREMPSNEQIACVHVAPDYNLDIGVVGFWNSGSISIIDMDSHLTPLQTQTLRRSDDHASIPRDLALIQVLPPSVSGPTLFIAMEDGNVITYNVSKKDFALTGRKSVILGTSQARFFILPQAGGLINLFAATEHPSLIYGAENRIVYSAVTAEDTRCVCAFDTDTFPECIVMATDTQIRISRIDKERQTHVQALKMGETVRRIAYSGKEQIFALACIKREIEGNQERLRSFVRIVDEVIFESLGSGFPLDYTTTGQPAASEYADRSGHDELCECLLRAELPDSQGELQERFLVGTSFKSGDPSDTRGGFLRVLGVDSERKPYLIMCHPFKGNCRQVTMMGDLLVVALTKTVVVCKYVEKSSTSGELIRLASYRPSTYPVDLAVQGNIIAVGDLIKSLSLIQYFPAESGKEAMLMEVARNYRAGWTTSIIHVEDQSWLQADISGNLVMLTRNTAGIILEEKRRMQITSEMNLGEQVNRMRPIVVEADEKAMIVPRAFLGTVEGSIYLFGTIASHAQDLLMRFQSRLAESGEIKTLGNLDFRQYRGFMDFERERDGPDRFVDGDMLERFLELSEAAQARICEGLGPSVEDMRNTVEELRRMH